MKVQRLAFATIAALLATVSLAHFEPDGSVPVSGSVTAVGDPKASSGDSETPLAPVVAAPAETSTTAVSETAEAPNTEPGTEAGDSDGSKVEGAVAESQAGADAAPPGGADVAEQVAEGKSAGSGASEEASQVAPGTSESDVATGTPPSAADSSALEPINTPLPGAADPAVAPSAESKSQSDTSTGPTPGLSPEESPLETVEETVDETPEETPEDTSEDPAKPTESGEEDDDGSTCFPEDATVELENGSMKRMDQVVVGDVVRTGVSSFSKVFMFTHKDASVRNMFLTLTTSSGASITLTKSHYIYVDGHLVAASEVSLGAGLTLSSGAREAVVEISHTRGTGLYNPQTVDGNVVVNGVLASTYTTAVEPGLAHGLLVPFRKAYAAFGLYTSAFDAGSEALSAVAPSGRPIVV